MGSHSGTEQKDMRSHCAWCREMGKRRLDGMVKLTVMVCEMDVDMDRLSDIQRWKLGRRLGGYFGGMFLKSVVCIS